MSYTFHKPSVQLSSAPALREVRYAGEPIGLINRHVNGYAVRDLEGRLLEVVPLHDRKTAASALLERKRAADAVASITGPELLKSFAHLTHQMDTYRRSPLAAGIKLLKASNLRSERDLVEAEILRRMGADQ